MINNKESKIEVPYLWEISVKNIAKLFKMDDREKDMFKRSRIAMLIGTLPYIANCENAERISISNLSTYILSTKQPVTFTHSISDDANVFARLALINNLKHGDEDIILKGMSLLALNMIYDYKRDMKEDLINNKYNPLNSGKWVYKEIITELKNNILNVVSHDLDSIMKYEETKFMYWNYI